ncbi:ABC-F type ribosomal protection protein [Bacillus sp. FSL K6-0047]|uniref:ribosomal protection-like ABC-F family protein n=1 Tax=Shouchella TaxID=2893057 RepID=UPI000BA77616|nr:MULTISPECIES: ABC-F type ribosomal protection protein [Shouchella]MCM3378445.1 ABC-F type ribosomal protection protein [Shouchella rhizosphaerae]PAE83304.1 ABC-F type ribosomal protection protein [Shouchella clausii]
MLLMKAKEIKKSVGARELLNIKGLYLYKGDRVGLVGNNGAGKSTLLRILAGEGKADLATVETYGSVAYVPQLENENEAVAGELASKWHVPDGSVQTMSGGEQTRKKIAAALASDPHIFIADEPTSHLDIDGIKQLEKELTAFNGAVLLTSHDKVLVNKVCTTIWELEDGCLTVYEGNYDHYLKQKQANKQKVHKEYEAFVQEKNRLEQAAKQIQAKSAKIKKAPSRMGNSEARLHKRSSGVQKAKLNRAAEAMRTRIEQLEVKEKPKEVEPIRFDMAQFPTLHSKRAVQFQGCPVQIGANILKANVHGEVPTGSRLAIIGPNGSGKTTLARQIVDRSGGLHVAAPAKVGFFQQQQENLHEGKTVLENMIEDSPYTQTFIRTVLSRLAFSRDEVDKKAAVLSGGERVRASLAKVFLSNCNVLVLDEPTNYLDIATKDSLLEVLKAYPGTICFVTHERALIDDLATHILSFADEEPTVTMVAPDAEEHKRDGAEEVKAALLAVELKLSETLGRLSTAVDEHEKQELDQTFQQLLAEKKRLLQ